MSLSLIENDETYYEFIRLVRTHTQNISGFVEKKQFSKEEQIKYMEKYKKNYFICLSGDTPVGFIGVVNDDIRLAVDPKYKNHGVGTYMIEQIKTKFENAIAKVFLNNIQSQKVFEKNGFKKFKSDNLFNYYKYENKL